MTNDLPDSQPMRLATYLTNDLHDLRLRILTATIKRLYEKQTVVNADNRIFMLVGSNIKSDLPAGVKIRVVLLLDWLSNRLKVKKEWQKQELQKL